MVKMLAKVMSVFLSFTLNAKDLFFGVLPMWDLGYLNSKGGIRSNEKNVILLCG